MAKRDSKGSYTVWFTLKNNKRGRWTFHTTKARDAGETNIKNLIDLASGIETKQTRDSLKWALEQKAKDEKLYLKLIEWGLIEDDHDQERTIRDICDHFQKKSVKPGTLLTFKQIEQNLKAFFGEGKRLRDIRPVDATDFENFLYTAARTDGKGGLGKATVKKRVQRAKQFFLEARRLHWIADNPFDAVHGGNLANPKKWLYVPRETVLEVMENTPNLETRAKIALCRFAGARGESEFRPLEWNADWIQWSADGKQGTVRLHRTKTEDKGFEDTIIPMDAALEGALRDLFDSAEPGTVKVFTQRANAGKTIKDQFIRNKVDIRTPYNLRRSYCRDLMEKGIDPRTYEYYAGHTLAVALKHYQSWDELRAQKAAPQILEALKGSDADQNRRADRRAEESNLESRNHPKENEGTGNGNKKYACIQEHFQEKEISLQDVSRSQDRGRGIRTPNQGIMSPLL